MIIDTSNEAVERLAEEYERDAQRFAPSMPGREFRLDAAAMLRALRQQRNMWRYENDKKQTACEQMGARIKALEAERNVERENAETLDAICQRTEAERDEAVATLALYRMKNGCTRGQRTTQWCDAAEKVLAERDRLRAALQEVIERGNGCHPMSTEADYWRIAYVALAETGHE
jgi:type II secretory pathway component PulJ